jgi:hypothetical protein
VIDVYHLRIRAQCDVDNWNHGWEGKPGPFAGMDNGEFL